MLTTMRTINQFANNTKTICAVAFGARKISSWPIQENNEIAAVKSFDEIPGPKPAPILGFMWHVLPKVGRYQNLKIFDLHKALNKDYGNLVRLRDLKVSDDIVLCFDPKDIEVVFRNEGPWPKRDILPSVKYYRETLRKDIFQGYGGVFCSDDKNWQDARSIQNSVLMKPQVVKQYTEDLSNVSNEFIEQIKYLASQNAENEMPANFMNELNKWALESVGILALDERFGALDRNIQPDSEIQQLLNDINLAFKGMYENDVKPSLSKYISTPGWRRYIATYDRITSFLLKRIEKAKTKINSEEYINKDKNYPSMIENLVRNHDDKYILSNTMDIIIAGVDTTSRSQAAILYLLAQHPEIQETLRKEVLSVFPSKEVPFSYQKLDKMPYLRAVIKEALRLIPISLGVSRKATKDMVLSGYQIPKGTSLVVEQLPLLHNEKYFKNAEKFQPERWLRNEMKYEVVNPWAYLPFGFGPRACVGKRIAQLEMEILTTQIMRNFKVGWHHQDAEFDLHLFYGIVSPLKLQMTPLSN